jgi:hypothetical protein
MGVLQQTMVRPLNYGATPTCTPKWVFCDTICPYIFSLVNWYTVERY